MSWLLNVGVLRSLILPALDVLILAFIIYKGYQILVQTRAVQLVKGALFVVLTYAVAFFLHLRTLLWILNFLAPSLVIGIAIIFQPELRKIFTRLGQGRLLQFSGTSKSYQLDSVIKSVESLAFRRRGALIVFSRTVGLKNIIESGTRMDAELSSELLMTIFAHDTALHDGAVVVEEGKVAAAGCFLPLSEQLDVRRSFGTRHRAALGLAEETDAVVLVVSEETGALSLAYEANLYYDMTADEVKRKLIALLQLGADPALDEEVSAFEE
ncbi:MAG: TIGR00159 family protein [Spirochaetaceae bacterium]|nr:MAG: TIGR00159 family protein [Spirochaetaceae bacterium]